MRTPTRLIPLLGMLALLSCESDPLSPIDETLQPDASRARVNPQIQLISPARVAFGRRRRVYISDPGAGSVFEYRIRHGQMRPSREIHTGGMPVGVAWGRHRVFVGNSRTQRVEIYRGNGRYVGNLGARARFWRRSGHAVGETIERPVSIAVDRRHERVFVLDAGRKNVKVFDLRTRALLGTVISVGTGPGYLQSPTALTIDPVAGEILVSDYGDMSAFSPAAEIKIFTYDGTPVTTISGRDADFSRPQGLRVVNDKIFLADGLRGEIMILNRSDGSVVGTLGSYGTGPGQLLLPLDAAVNHRGRVFVTNNRLARIEEYDAGGYVQ